MPLSKAREMMNEALNLAQAAAAQGEVPVGAIVVKDGVIMTPLPMRKSSQSAPLRRILAMTGSRDATCG